MAARKPICSVENCNRTANIRGFCGLHYQRWKKHGDPLHGDGKRAAVGRANEFLRSMPVTDDCVLWPFGILPNGYGSAYLDGKTIGAHRLSFMIHCGEIPKGMYVLHSCDNPTCCNPRHLRAGTPLDNMQDKVNRGRLVVPRGEQSRHAKLTESDVIEIRKLYASGMTQLKLAKEFGVSQPHIGDIVRCEVWKHLPKPHELLT